MTNGQSDYQANRQITSKCTRKYRQTKIYMKVCNIIEFQYSISDDDITSKNCLCKAVLLRFRKWYKKMGIPLSTWVSEQVKDKQVHKGALLLKISTVLSCLNIACQGEDCLLFWLYYRSRQDDTFELIRLAHNSFGVGRYRILLTTCIQAGRSALLFSYRIYSYFSFNAS